MNYIVTVLEWGQYKNLRSIDMTHLIYNKFILPILILLLISSGCIDINNGEKIINAKANDLKLSISMNNSIFSNESDIVVFVKMRNCADVTVKVSEIFTFTFNIKFLITSGFNNTIEIFPEHGDFFEENEILLQPSNYLETSINLNDPNQKLYFLNQSTNAIERYDIFNGGNGEKIIQIKYISIDPNIYSNELYFDLI
jgi:hypothetical protein